MQKHLQIQVVVLYTRSGLLIYEGYNIQKKSNLSSMFEFKNLDLCSFYDIDNDIPTSADKPLKNQAFTAVNTFDRNSLGSQDEFFYQKSSHLLAQSYEISFEKDFMKEHQTVFERQLQNYMESFRTYQKINGIKPHLETQNYSSKENHAITCIDFIRSHTFGFCFEETQTFVKKFTTYDKLSEFLKIVVRSAPQKTSIQLIHIARELLEKYEGVKIENPSEKELLKIAQSVSESYKFAELAEIKAANLVNTAKVMESSKKFLEVFCATCMLVIAQYFQNPFSSQEGSFKRPLFSSNDGEEQQEISQLSQSSKKRKFSF